MVDLGTEIPSERPNLQVTYRTDSGNTHRVSFIPQTDGRWLRIKEEIDTSGWRYMGSELVSDLTVDGSWAPDELDMESASEA